MSSGCPAGSSTPSKRDEIEERLARVDAIRDVHNDLRVQGFSQGDVRLRLEIHGKIYSDPLFERWAGLPDPPVRVFVERGRATLVGTVGSDVERVVAGMLARGTLAFAVNNQVKVEERRRAQGRPQEGHDRELGGGRPPARLREDAPREEHDGAGHEEHEPHGVGLVGRHVDLVPLGGASVVIPSSVMVPSTVMKKPLKSHERAEHRHEVARPRSAALRCLLRPVGERAVGPPVEPVDHHPEVEPDRGSAPR